jgi:hypothetical protein
VPQGLTSHPIPTPQRWPCTEQIADTPQQVRSHPCAHRKAMLVGKYSTRGAPNRCVRVVKKSLSLVAQWQTNTTYSTASTKHKKSLHPPCTLQSTLLFSSLTPWQRRSFCTCEVEQHSLKDYMGDKILAKSSKVQKTTLTVGGQVTATKLGICRAHRWKGRLVVGPHSRRPLQQAAP